MGSKNTEVYNPLEGMDVDRSALAKSIAKAFMERDIHALPPKKFSGAGIYAIYYFGDFPDYEPFKEYNDPSRGNFVYPLYVGKAVPSGRRKGLTGLDSSSGNKLYDRLNKHSRTLKKAKNLDIDDFRCRYMLVDNLWIPLAETLMIQLLKPLWNQCIDGFGNNDPGGKRYDGAIPDWHIIHPGVPWADKMTGDKTPLDDLSKKIITFASNLSVDLDFD